MGGGNPFTAGWTVVAVTYAGFGLAVTYGRRMPLKGDCRRPQKAKSARRISRRALHRPVREGRYWTKKQPEKVHAGAAPPMDSAGRHFRRHSAQRGKSLDLFDNPVGYRISLFINILIIFVYFINNRLFYIFY
ncbi:MAG: hypothetical protein LBP69_11765 [Treponema sp.]|jgi:hypothetical protein|nr:hypothetical protein [Treponema sp.]